MIELARCDLELDLSAFVQWLATQHVPHRVVEESGDQVVYVAESAQALVPQLRLLLQRFVTEPVLRAQLQDFGTQLQPEIQESVQTVYPRVLPQQAPLVFLMLGLAVLLAVLTGFGSGGPILRAFLMVDPLQLDFRMQDLSGRWDGLLVMLQTGQFWRLISPAFIHFSILHLIFNALMIWVLGGQLELHKGSHTLLKLVLFVSVLSNLAQLLSSHYLFGGLSGVVYGLFGYTWLWRKQASEVFMPDAFWNFALIWLVIGFTPLTEWLGIGRMANAAHLGGLLAGLVWGWLTLGREKNEKIPE